MKIACATVILNSAMIASTLAQIAWAEETLSAPISHERATIIFKALPARVLPEETGHPFGVRIRYPAGRDATWPGYTVYRDVEGRTRIEYSVLSDSTGKGGITIVEIRDLISGWQYVLDVANKIAHRARVSEGIEVAGLPMIPHSGQQMGNPLLALNSVPPPDHPTAIVNNMGFWMQPELRIPAEGRLVVELKPGSATAVKEWLSDRRGIDVTRAFWSAEGSGVSSVGMGWGTAKPDPVLFRIDSDFRIVDESGEFAIEIGR
jgi:hypothetical protein